MFGWLKRWAEPEQEPSVDSPSIEQLVAQSQELGRQIDELREQRRLLKQHIDALIPVPKED